MSDLPDRLIQQLSFAIRNPINVILGTIDLHGTTETTPEQDHYMQMIQRSAMQLMEASDSLLDLFELRSGAVKPDYQEFDISELVLEAVKFRQPSARNKGLEIEVLMESDLVNPCLTDPFLLKKILSQLLDNAIKFTDKGAISIHVSRAPVPPSGQVNQPHLCIEVKDTGIGIPQNRLSSLFDGPSEEKNYRSTYDGAGLGLLLVSRMTEMIGGTISVESEPTVGSKFQLIFPVQSVEKRMSGDIQLSGSREKGEHAKGIRILCAEDDPDSRYLVEHHLRAMGWEVRMASNGKEALEACKQETFDVVLMDVQMPEMDGFEATAAIRSLSNESGTQGSHVPIIALTAHALKQDREICLQSGMDDYLSKPVHREELYSVIDYHVKAARQRDSVEH
ncbi:MAG: response regulator [Leptospiraceae bacterium]